jgi:hypothetical protein
MYSRANGDEDLRTAGELVVPSRLLALRTLVVQVFKCVFEPRALGVVCTPSTESVFDLDGPQVVHNIGARLPVFWHDIMMDIFPFQCQGSRCFNHSVKKLVPCVFTVATRQKIFFKQLIDWFREVAL